MLNLSLKFVCLGVLALLLATCGRTGKDLVIHKSFPPSNKFTKYEKTKVGNYELAWSNRAGVSAIVTVNGVAHKNFTHMRIRNVQVLQFPNETLYVFQVWCGAVTQNSQLMLVRLSGQMVEEAVSVMGPTTLDDQFNHIETIPIKEKGSIVGSLFNFYIDDDKVAVYRYSSSKKFVQDYYYPIKGDKVPVYTYSPGYLTKVVPAASLGLVWHQRYTGTREAAIAEIIAAALDYRKLDPEIREVLAGVIVSGESANGVTIHYNVDEMRYTHHSDDTASIKLYISSEGCGYDEAGFDIGALELVEIKLSRRGEGDDYVIQSVTLTLLAG